MMRANSVSQSLIQADDTPWKDWKWKEMRNSRCSNEPSNRSQKAEKTPRSGMHKKEKENQNQENMIAIPWKSAWLSSLPSHIQSAASFHFISFFLSFFVLSSPLLSSSVTTPWHLLHIGLFSLWIPSRSSIFHRLTFSLFSRCHSDWVIELMRRWVTSKNKENEPMCIKDVTVL